MSCTANSKYGIKELSTIFDSGMLLPYLCQRGCSGYSRFTRPWTEYFYGKLLEDADIGVGEDYSKENSTIIRVNESVSWWSSKSIALQLSGGKCSAPPTASTALRSSPLSLIAECSCRTFDRGVFWI